MMSSGSFSPKMPTKRANPVRFSVVTFTLNMAELIGELGEKVGTPTVQECFPMSFLPQRNRAIEGLQTGHSIGALFRKKPERLQQNLSYKILCSNDGNRQSTYVASGTSQQTIVSEVADLDGSCQDVQLLQHRLLYLRPGRIELKENHERRAVSLALTMAI